MSTRVALLALTFAACGSSPRGAPDGGDQPGDVDASTAEADAGAPPADSPEPCDLIPEACGHPPPEAPTIELLQVLVPSDKLPAGLEIQISNNNVDMLFHEGRLFVAFRTASHHHPREDATLHVISSSDLDDWKAEGTFVSPTDLREPNLFVRDGDLHLLFTAVEAAETNFSPIGPMVARRSSDGSWSQPDDIIESGLLVWRVKPHAGELYATGYAGVEGILDFNNVETWWMQSDDGYNWSPADGVTPAVLRGGTTESDTVFLDDGSVVAVARNDFGDEDENFGSKICRAPASDPTKWLCADDPKKYDSPLLFRHGDEVYLIGRRNMNKDGAYYLGHDWLPGITELGYYMGAYWLEQKRCSLWRVDPVSLTVEYVLDLHSAGDTCFPEVLQLDSWTYLVVNYTSPLDGDDPSWRDAQDEPTQIVLELLRLPE